MTDQEIIDNAPEGATHWDCSEYMIHVHDGNWNYWSKAAGWNETKPEEETRSLADIKRIVELEGFNVGLAEESCAQQKRIAELEKERDEYHAMVVYTGAIMDESEGVAGYHLNGDIAKWDDLFTVTLYKDALQAHNLEQQAKALQFALENITNPDLLYSRLKALKAGE